MGVLIIIVGILQILGGVGVLVSAQSAIHEILGTVAFGLGTLSIALGLAVQHLAAIRKALSQKVSPQ